MEVFGSSFGRTWWHDLGVPIWGRFGGVFEVFWKVFRAKKRGKYKEKNILKHNNSNCLGYVFPKNLGLDAILAS